MLLVLAIQCPFQSLQGSSTGRQEAGRSGHGRERSDESQVKVYYLIQYLYILSLFGGNTTGSG